MLSSVFAINSEKTAFDNAKRKKAGAPYQPPGPVGPQKPDFSDKPGFWQPTGNSTAAAGYNAVLRASAAWEFEADELPAFLAWSHLLSVGGTP